jgi:hypothetical protein
MQEAQGPKRHDSELPSGHRRRETDATAAEPIPVAADASPPATYPQTWYEGQPFATFEESPQYRQLRMTALDGSFGKTFAEQQVFLPADKKMPSARVVIMDMVIHFLATGERLFSESVVHCTNNDSDGRRVGVGFFSHRGLYVDHSWGDRRDDFLSLASARKF